MYKKAVLVNRRYQWGPGSYSVRQLILILMHNDGKVTIDSEFYGAIGPTWGGPDEWIPYSVALEKLLIRNNIVTEIHFCGGVHQEKCPEEIEKLMASGRKPEDVEISGKTYKRIILVNRVKEGVVLDKIIELFLILVLDDGTVVVDKEIYGNVEKRWDLRGYVYYDDALGKLLKKYNIIAELEVYTCGGLGERECPEEIEKLLRPEKKQETVKEAENGEHTRVRC
ncbi:MAG: hypothetical protein QXM08_01200 [Thermofilaceae archaeon]